MDSQLKSYFTIQGMSHAINIYNYPKEYSNRSKLLGYRYLLQNQIEARKVLRNIPSINQIIKKLFDFFNEIAESLIQIENPRVIYLNRELHVKNTFDMNEIVDIVLEYSPTNGEILLNKLREIERESSKKNTILSKICSDSQNVHNSFINESIKNITKKLYEKYSSTNDFKILRVEEDIKFILSVTFPKKVDIISKVFLRINSDISNFNIGISLSDTLKCLWLWIYEQEETDELLKRLVEEIYEMEGQCASGHLSRLINVTQGFSEEFNISSNEKDYLEHSIYKFLNKKLKECKDELVIEGIVDKNEEYLSFIKQTVENINWKKEFSLDKIENFDEIKNIVNKFSDFKIFE
jgi:hypothetical protein